MAPRAARRASPGREELPGVGKGQRVPFVLTWYPSNEPLPEAIDAEAALAGTEERWCDWSGRCTHEGRWREPVLGDFPQAFTHVGLVNTAPGLARRGSAVLTAGEAAPP